MGKREIKYPQRIAGMSFGEEDYQGVQSVRRELGLTEAEVVRRCVSIGLLAYEGSLGERIRRAAVDDNVSVRTIVEGAVTHGLSDFLVWWRHNVLEKRIRQIRDELGEREAELNDEERSLFLALDEHLEHADAMSLEHAAEEDDWYWEYDEDYEIESKGAEYRKSALTEIGKARKKHLDRIEAERRKAS